MAVRTRSDIHSNAVLGLCLRLLQLRFSASCESRLRFCLVSHRSFLSLDVWSIEMSNNSTESAADSEIKPRLAMNAVLLSLVVTGLGQIYCGELVGGLAWAAAGAVCGVISLWGMTSEQYGIVVTSLPMWTVSIASAIHACYLAKHSVSDYRLRSFNQWKVYLLLGAIGTFGAAGYGFLMRVHVVMAYVTPVSDMEPTLQKGDRFLVDKTAYRTISPARGSVVVFKSPAKPSLAYVKRVIALENDVVEIRDGQLLINGEPRASARKYKAGDVADFGPFVVPAHNLFVVGDSLANSKDSRHFGPIAKASVEGKAVRVFWPPNAWFSRSIVE